MMYNLYKRHKLSVCCRFGIVQFKIANICYALFFPPVKPDTKHTPGSKGLYMGIPSTVPSTQ